MTVPFGCDGFRPSMVVVRWLILVAVFTAGASCGSAQQVAVSTPMQIVNDRYSGGGGMRLFAEQGSRRSFTSQTPTVVVPQGGTGAIFSGSLRPFVVGVVPVVGDEFGYAPITVWPQGGTRNCLVELTKNFSQHRICGMIAAHAVDSRAGRRRGRTDENLFIWCAVGIDSTNGTSK